MTERNKYGFTAEEWASLPEKERRRLNKKRKADFTPEEWAVELEKRRGYKNRIDPATGRTRAASQAARYRAKHPLKVAEAKFIDHQRRAAGGWKTSVVAVDRKVIARNRKRLATMTEAEIAAAIVGKLPRIRDPEIRLEAMSEVCVLLMEGLISLDQIGLAANRYAFAIDRAAQYAPILSIDEPLPGNDKGRTFADLILADAVHF